MPDKQSHDSPLPILVLAVCMAGTSLAAGKAPHAVPTMDMASTTLTTMQTPNEEELKKAVTKIDAMTKATAETKRQMEATNRIAGYMKASKNMPSKLANKAVTEAQYWKDVYVLTNLELLSAKSDKTKAETAIAAAKSKATADAAAEEKKKADTKVADTKKNYDNAKKKADDAAAKARAAKKDPKVAAAKENEAAAKAKADYDAAVAAKRTSDAKATATASNAKRDETAATNAKNAARAKADTISGQKRIVEQSKGRATSAANAWEAERKRMENNPFNRACDNVDRAITDTIEKAKDDPVAAAASVVKTAIGGLDGVVTGAISAAANSAWFKGTKVGTTVDIAAYLKELPGKPKDIAIDQTANLVSSIYKAKTVKEALNLFGKAEDQRKTENFKELADKVFDLIKAYDKDFDKDKYRKVLFEVYDCLPPGAKLNL